MIVFIHNTTKSSLFLWQNKNIGSYFRGSHMCNRLITTFLEDEKHQKLYSDYLQNPSQINKDLIEDHFKIHVTKIKVISYFSRVLYFEAQRFDKKIRYDLSKGALILDNEEIKDEIQYNDSSYTIQEDLELILENANIENIIDDEKLFNILSNLNEKNKTLLDLLFIKGMNESEVASHLGISHQAVNKRKNSILKSIRKLYKI